MKKIAGAIIILSVLIAAVIFGADSMLFKVENPPSDILLSIPYSSNILGITGVNSVEGGEAKTCPESFFVTEDHHIYIVDTGNGRILNFYNGDVVETIEVDTGNEHMIDMALHKKDIYVLLDNDVILKVDHKGTLLN